MEKPSEVGRALTACFCRSKGTQDVAWVVTALTPLHMAMVLPFFSSTWTWETEIKADLAS